MNEVQSTPPLVEVFSGPHCSYCLRAKNLLSIKGVVYRELDVSDPGVREMMLQRVPRARSIPQIFIDGEHIGGCDDLELLDAQGSLDRLLARGAH